jgi:hypothetical protein
MADLAAAVAVAVLTAVAVVVVAAVAVAITVVVKLLALVGRAFSKGVDSLHALVYFWKTVMDQSSNRFWLFIGIFVGGWLLSFVYHQLLLRDRAQAEPTPQIQTSPDIIGIEIPVRPKDGKGAEAVLKAAFADQMGEKEIRVYGGFEYRSPDKIITGEEAIINLETGNTRGMKGIKIWDR